MTTANPLNAACLLKVVHRFRSTEKINQQGFSPFGEGHLRGHCNLALAPLDGHHPTAQVAGFPVHLDALLKKLLLETECTNRTSHHC